MLALRIAKLPKIIKPDWKSWVAKSEILRSRRSPRMITAKNIPSHELGREQQVLLHFF